MQEINWGNFRAKFNGKEQKIFELLSYLLFCDEFNIKTGIFRYKNQAGIETEPILVDGKWIGFQAKFYETKLSDNKSELIGSITRAKKKNPQLKRILFYLNQEFPESSDTGKKEPQYKIDIEAAGRREGIEIGCHNESCVQVCRKQEGVNSSEKIPRTGSALRKRGP